MSLTEGTRLGSYEITGQIGAGGMGEVYRATDTRLGRDVAIKTLPAALALDKDRLARFEREAKLLAGLNHPHIAAVHSLDEHEGTLYLAMELVEGETLEEKLRAGALPVEDALRLALQIAEALEAAHQKGVVHRDLKPANVMVTADGIVKVLDFGLAKAFSEGPNQSNVAQSPALSVAMTQQGLVLGTAGYMSPEQASGQPTDQRADIWAFGVVLYEMLTGLPLFSGESVPHVLADVLKTEPDWNRLPKRLHTRVRQLLERCLTKRPRDRYHSIADARIDIEFALANPDAVGAYPDARRGPGPLWSAVAIVLVVAAAVFALQLMPAAESPPVTRFSIPMSPAFARTLGLLPNSAIAVSSDGRSLAYVTETGLERRDLDSFDVRPITESRGATMPFFSGDGRWLGFLSGGLRRISLEGGRPTAIVDLDDVAGASWGQSGTVLYGTQSSGLYRVSGDGGDPIVVTVPVGENEAHSWPKILPGETKALFTLVKGDVISGALGTMDVAVVDLDTGDTRVLLPGSQPHFVQPGHIVFARDTTLWAAPFDSDRTELLGEAIPIVEDVGISFGAPTQFAVNGGTLAYFAGLPSDAAQLVWVDRMGYEEPLTFEPQGYWTPKLSKAGDRVVVARSNPVEAVWVGDIERGVQIQISEPDAENAVWMPDDATILYVANRDEQRVTLQRRADGSGNETIVPLGEPIHHHMEEISRDGEWVAWAEVGLGTAGEDNRVWVSRLDGSDGMYFPPETAGVSSGAFSPDTSWFAYTAIESGEPHVYVASFPDGDRRTLVSVGWGAEPMWSRDGSEIFYRNGSRMMAVSVEDLETMELGVPTELFEGDYILTPVNAGGRNYDLGLDGRFLMVKPIESSDNFRLNIESNWSEELKRLVPTD